MTKYKLVFFITFLSTFEIIASASEEESTNELNNLVKTTDDAIIIPSSTGENDEVANPMSDIPEKVNRLLQTNIYDDPTSISKNISKSENDSSTKKSDIISRLFDHFHVTSWEELHSKLPLIQSDPSDTFFKALQLDPTYMNGENVNSNTKEKKENGDSSNNKSDDLIWFDQEVPTKKQANPSEKSLEVFNNKTKPNSKDEYFHDEIEEKITTENSRDNDNLTRVKLHDDSFTQNDPKNATKLDFVTLTTTQPVLPPLVNKTGITIENQENPSSKLKNSDIETKSSHVEDEHLKMLKNSRKDKNVHDPLVNITDNKSGVSSKKHPLPPPYLNEDIKKPQKEQGQQLKKQNFQNNNYSQVLTLPNKKSEQENTTIKHTKKHPIHTKSTVSSKQNNDFNQESLTTKPKQNHSNLPDIKTTNNLNNTKDVLTKARNYFKEPANNSSKTSQAFNVGQNEPLKHLNDEQRDNSAVISKNNFNTDLRHNNNNTNSDTKPISKKLNDLQNEAIPVSTLKNITRVLLNKIAELELLINQTNAGNPGKNLNQKLDDNKPSKKGNLKKYEVTVSPRKVKGQKPYLSGDKRTDSNRNKGTRHANQASTKQPTNFTNVQTVKKSKGSSKKVPHPSSSRSKKKKHLDIKKNITREVTLKPGTSRVAPNSSNLDSSKTQKSVSKAPKNSNLLQRTKVASKKPKPTTQMYLKSTKIPSSKPLGKKVLTPSKSTISKHSSRGTKNKSGLTTTPSTLKSTPSKSSRSHGTSKPLDLSFTKIPSKLISEVSTSTTNSTSLKSQKNSNSSMLRNSTPNIFKHINPKNKDYYFLQKYLESLFLKQNKLESLNVFKKNKLPRKRSYSKLPTDTPYVLSSNLFRTPYSDSRLFSNHFIPEDIYFHPVSDSALGLVKPYYRQTYGILSHEHQDPSAYKFTDYPNYESDKDTDVFGYPKFSDQSYFNQRFRHHKIGYSSQYPFFPETSYQYQLKYKQPIKSYQYHDTDYYSAHHSYFSPEDELSLSAKDFNVPIRYSYYSPDKNALNFNKNFKQSRKRFTQSFFYENPKPKMHIKQSSHFYRTTSGKSNKNPVLKLLRQRLLN